MPTDHAPDESHDAAADGADPGAAAAALSRHHRSLVERLADLVDAVAAAAEDGEADAEAVALLGWYRTALLPHFKAAEAVLYARGRERSGTALLVRTIRDGDDRVRRLIEDLDAVGGPIEAVAAAASARELFDAHVRQVEELLLPALRESGVELAGALDGQHDLVGGERTTPEAAPKPPPADREAPAGPPPISGTEELDVRALPHQQRHGIILGKMQALTDDGTLVLINDHDPKPLRYQADAFWPHQFDWTYLQEGPDDWKVAITRV